MSPPEPPSKIIPGGVTAPAGFLASGIRAGIKEEGLDLALLFSEKEADVAGVFTCNAMAAAPVILCRNRIAAGKARAVVVNSGNANACTGEQGDRDALAMTRRTAEALGLPDDEQVLVASTGVIGQTLPMTKIHNAIPAAVAALGESAGEDAAQAIMTTDAFPKTAAVEVSLSGGKVRVGGMGKGAGMIRPRMIPAGESAAHATMLAFITTDASVKTQALRDMLESSVDNSFNCISVDGETSTNDTVLLLANGASGVEASATSDLDALRAGIESVCTAIAHAIVRDGEGATKFVTIRVTGATDEGQARKAAFAVADSMLVKTALFGNDPNWGRIVSAVGACGVELETGGVRVAINGTEVLAAGRAGQKRPASPAVIIDGPEIEIEVGLGAGNAAARVWASDLSYEYVRINAEYHT